MRPETVRRVAPLVVAALVLTVIGVVWVVLRADDPPVSGAGSDGGPEGPATTLKVAGWSPADTDTPDPRYRLAPGADLPEGPGSAPVHQVRTSPGSDGTARALAETLGLTGAPVDTGHETAWQGERRRLSVQQTPGRPWSYTGGLGTVSSGAPDSREPSDARVPVTTTSANQARLIARELLRDAGLADGAETVGPPGSWVEVQVDPEVGGLPTTGFGTTLVVAGDTVQSGAGWLATTTRGPAYPLVTAREAWDALVRTPLPMPLIACAEPAPDSVDPVACGGPVTVTGARLGLSLRETDDGPTLVPAWLFTVAKSVHPLVQLAVEPRLMASSDGGAAGGTSGSPGSAVPPAPPSTAPSAEPPDSRFTSVRRGDDDRSIDVTFWGGVPECYDYDVRAAEDDRAVRISVVERRTAGDKPCIDLAVEVRRTVRLDAPLGLRQVVDPETGETLLGPAK